MTIWEKTGKLFNLVFCAAFGWIIVVVLWRALKSFGIALAIAAAVIAAAVWLVKSGRTLPRVNYKAAFYIALAVGFAVMTATAFALEVDYSWDWGRLMISASNYVLGGYIDDVEYFATYPNNQLWFTLLVALLRLVKLVYPAATALTFKTVSVVVSVGLVQTSILFTYKTARLFWSEKRAFLTGLAAELFLPLYLYAMFAYTDTVGMPVLILTLYFYQKAKRTRGIKRLACCAAVGVCAAVAYWLKVTVFIVFIAVVIEAALFVLRKEKRSRLKEYAVNALSCALAFAVISAAASAAVEATIPISEKTADKYEFPPVHWVMMALNPTGGGYWEEDVKYTKSFTSRAAKKRADEKRMMKRLEKMGLRGTVKHIAYTKVVRTWSDSCLYGDDYVSRYSFNPNGPLQRVLARNGDLHFICLLYSWPYYIILLLLILASGVLSVKRTIADQPALACRIAIFGLFLFLSIWECNARYLVVFVPVLMLTAADGAFALADKTGAFSFGSGRRRKRLRSSCE